MQITVNETGARTLADARPMLINGSSVYVSLGGGTAHLIVGGEIVAEMVTDDMSTREAQDWAVEYRTSLADVNAVEEAVNVDAVYAGTVEMVHAVGAELDAEADKLAAEATPGEYKFRNVTGRMSRVHENDPRHPMNAARQLKRQAAILLAWTAQDEAGYGQYISDGVADTDGFYAPLTRQAWKAPLAS